MRGWLRHLVGGALLGVPSKSVVDLLPASRGWSPVLAVDLWHQRVCAQRGQVRVAD